MSRMKVLICKLVRLFLIVSCNNLGMSKQFNESCFGHALLKMCQYATIDEKTFHGLNYASIKFI
jgi:hypothetical protein